jgi:hypothetical protein
LVAKNSEGESIAITAIVKTQGSDTKLVAQMQPCYEARSAGPMELAGRRVPPLVTQIADGENGGVMMNEFPSKYLEAVRAASGTDVPLMNVSEYLEHLCALAGTEPTLRVISRCSRCRSGSASAGRRPERLAQAIRPAGARPRFPHGEWELDQQPVLGARLRQRAGAHGGGQLAVQPAGHEGGVPATDSTTATPCSIS